MTSATLAIEKVRIDGGTQSRAALNDEVVAEYAQRVRDGEDFPAITVFFDGSHHWLADGFHRLHAYRAAGAAEIEIDSRPGTKRDAVLFSVGANTDHGLRRTNDDKRRAVMALLNDAEWSKWSDREIARRCAVSHNFVSTIRSSLSSDDSERAYTTKHGTTATMQTAKIGKTPEQGHAENDASRDATRAALPPAVKAQQEAKAAAIAERRSAPGAAQDHSSRIDELEQANRFLEGRVADLEAKLLTYERLDLMYRDWTEGGWEQVVEAKDATIAEIQRTATARIASESHEKVSNLNAMRGLAKKLDEAGIGRDAVLDLETGEFVNG